MILDEIERLALDKVQETPGAELPYYLGLVIGQAKLWQHQYFEEVKKHLPKNNFKKDPIDKICNTIYGGTDAD